MKYSRILMLTFFSVFLMVVNSWGLPTLPNSAWSWNNSPYWTFSDTDGGTDDVGFTLSFEDATYESGFGLFFSDNDVITEFEVFDYTAEPQSDTDYYPTGHDVYFNNIGGEWYVKLDGEATTSDTLFSNVFGFYFAVSNDAKYYSDWDLNTPSSEKGIQHIAIAYNDLNDIYIFLDESLPNGADPDWNDMVVEGNDLKPVPEPATMLLLGSGLVVIAGLGRKRLLK